MLRSEPVFFVSVESAMSDEELAEHFSSMERSESVTPLSNEVLLAEVTRRLPGFEDHVKSFYEDLQDVDADEGVVFLLLKRHELWISPKDAKLLLEKKQTWEEFLRFMLQEELRMYKIFQQMDSSGDGELDQEDLRRFSFAMGVPVSVPEAKAMLRHADETPAETIIYSEWYLIMSHYVLRVPLSTLLKLRFGMCLRQVLTRGSSARKRVQSM